MTGSDYVGVATLITAVGAAVASIVVALRQTQTHTQIADVQHAVMTSDGRTLGEMVETSEERDKAVDANGGTTP